MAIAKNGTQMSLTKRANSSPNLNSRTNALPKSSPSIHHTSYGLQAEYDNNYDDDEFFVIGDRVYVDGYRPASVAYFGETDFGAGDWVGVVLDNSTGNHDGKLHGREYFQCAPNHGLFVRAHRLTRTSDSALGSSAASSRRSTPLPSAANNYQGFHYSNIDANSQNQARSSSRASTGSSSLLGSYFYDDDYRQNQVPSVASLAGKLRSIEERGQHVMESTNNYADPVSRTPTPVGILKRTNRWQQDDGRIEEGGPRSGRSNLGARFDEFDRRLRASSTSPSSPMATVFKFRPKREQLEASYDADGGKRQRSVNLSGSAEPLRKGDRVLVRTERDGELSGLLRFMGETNFATGEWAGVELDEPVGKNDGSILGCRYFHCPPNYGLFVPATRVKRCDPNRQGYSRSRGDQMRQHYGSHPSVFSAMRSTIKSPPPRSTSLSRQSSISRSTTPSYCNTDSLSPAIQQSSSMSAAIDRLHSDSRSPSSTSRASPLRTTNLDDFYFAEVACSPEPAERKSSNYYATNRATGAYDNWRSQPVAKFDDKDIELKLKQSLNRYRRPLTPTSSPVNRPKAVEYTFISSKLDGEPIARRTLIYE